MDINKIQRILLLCTTILVMFPASSVLADRACTHSSIVLPVHVSINSINTFLNQIAPRNLRETYENPITDEFAELTFESDTLRLEFSRSDINLSADQNTLVAHTDFRGSATLRGDITAIRGDVGRFLDRIAGSIVSPTVQETLEEIGIEVEASIEPTVTSDWRVIPRANAHINVYQADGRIIRVIPYSARSLVEGHVENFVSNEVDSFNHAIANDNRIHAEANEFWSSLHRVIKINDEPNIWLSIQPLYATAGQPKINSSGVDFTFVIEAFTSLSTGSKPSINTKPLPLLRLIDRSPDGQLNLALPLVVDWEAVNEAITVQLENNPAIIERGAGRLTVDSVTFVGANDKEIVATVMFSVHPSNLWGKLMVWIERLLSYFGINWELSNMFENQVIQMSAIPRLDESGTIISVYQADLTNQSSKLIKLVSEVYTWINNETIEDLVERKVIADLSKQFSLAEEGAQARINKITDNLRKHGIETDATILSVTRLSTIQISQSALLSKLCARAKVNVEVKRLDQFITTDQN